jgi:hypothetical protein
MFLDKGMSHLWQKLLAPRTNMEILAVIVRYQVALEDSTTFVSLDKAFENEPGPRDAVGVLIWDNSP